MIVFPTDCFPNLISQLTSFPTDNTFKLDFDQFLFSLDFFLFKTWSFIINKNDKESASMETIFLEKYEIPTMCF